MAASIAEIKGSVGEISKMAKETDENQHQRKHGSMAAKTEN